MKNEDLIVHWLIEVSEKLDIISYKLGINHDDLHCYFIAKTKEGGYTNDAMDAMRERLNNFQKTLKKIAGCKKEINRDTSV